MLEEIACLSAPTPLHYLLITTANEVWGGEGVCAHISSWYLMCGPQLPITEMRKWALHRAQPQGHLRDSLTGTDHSTDPLNLCHPPSLTPHPNPYLYSLTLPSLPSYIHPKGKKHPHSQGKACFQVFLPFNGALCQEP